MFEQVIRAIKWFDSTATLNRIRAMRKVILIIFATHLSLNHFQLQDQHHQNYKYEKNEKNNLP